MARGGGQGRSTQLGRVVLLSGCIFACAGEDPDRDRFAEFYRERQARPAAAAPVRWFEIDLSRVLEIPRLAEVTLPEGAREFRITQADPQVADDPRVFVRVLQVGGEAYGQLAKWWRPAASASAESDEAEGCGETGRGRVCVTELPLPVGVTWSSVAAQLSHAGVWELGPGCEASAGRSPGDRRPSPFVLERLQGDRHSIVRCDEDPVRSVEARIAAGLAGLVEETGLRAGVGPR